MTLYSTNGKICTFAPQEVGGAFIVTCLIMRRCNFWLTARCSVKDREKCVDATHLQVSVHDSPGMYVVHTFQNLPQQDERVFDIDAPIGTWQENITCVILLYKSREVKYSMKCVFLLCNTCAYILRPAPSWVWCSSRISSPLARARTAASECRA